MLFLFQKKYNYENKYVYGYRKFKPIYFTEYMFGEFSGTYILLSFKNIIISGDLIKESKLTFSLILEYIKRVLFV